MKKALFIIPLLLIVVYLAYEGLVLYDNHFPFGRMWETPALRPLERPMKTMDEGSVPFEGGENLYRSMPAGEILSPLKIDDPGIIRQGESRYFVFCAQCHGRNFDGLGTVGQSFFPPIPDLKSPAVQSLPGGVLFKWISYGKPGGRQPPLASTVDVSDRWKIIAFIRSLGVRR